MRDKDVPSPELSVEFRWSDMV